MKSIIAVRSPIQIAEGIEYRFSGSGFGNVYLTPARNAAVPAFLQEKTVHQLGCYGYYGFDHDWAIPVVIFEEEFFAWSKRYTPKAPGALIAVALKIIREQFSQHFRRYINSAEAKAA